MSASGRSWYVFFKVVKLSNVTILFILEKNGLKQNYLAVEYDLVYAELLQLRF